MDFRKIEYFVRVAELLNFRRAAEEIHISHQALSKQIRSLEDDLGVALFKRSTTKVVLTEPGKHLYQAFKPIVEAAYREYDKIEKLIEDRKSKLFIGYFNALSYHNMVEPVVDYLKGIRPDISIDVTAGDMEAVRDKLMNDRIDLLITVMPEIRTTESVQFCILDTFPLRIIVSSRHPWYDRTTPVTAEELEQASLLQFQTGDQSFMQHMKVKQRISIHNYDTYINRLYTGEEIGVIADIYSRREVEFRLLDLPDEYRADMHLVAAYKKDHPMRDLLKKLKNY